MGAEGAAEAVSDGVAEAAGEVQEAQGVAMVMAALPDPEDTSLDLQGGPCEQVHCAAPWRRAVVGEKEA